MYDVHTPKFPFGLRISENLNFISGKRKSDSIPKLIIKKNYKKSHLLTISDFDKQTSPKNDTQINLISYFKTAETDNEKKVEKVENKINLQSCYFTPKTNINFDSKKLFGMGKKSEKTFLCEKKNVLAKIGRQFGPARNLKSLNYRLAYFCLYVFCVLLSQIFFILLYF